MAVAYQQGSGTFVPGGGYMVSLDSAFFLPAFSLVFPVYLYFALRRPKTIPLLTNSIHSIQKGIPHYLPFFCLNKKINFNIAIIYNKTVTKQELQLQYLYLLYLSDN